MNLTQLESIRIRPGMYIGDVGVPGLHYLFREILESSIQEVLAGYCDQITVTLGKDRSLTVEDNGRALPIEVEAQADKTFLELVMTEYHNGVKPGNRDHRSFDGLHGVGALCVNALSERMETTVRRDGRIYRMRFARGVPISPLEVIGECGSDEQGTTQKWLADRDIFKTALTDAGELDYRPERLLQMMRELAFLNREVAITFTDALRDAAPVVFHYPKSVASYVESLNEGEAVLHEPIYLEASHGETQIMVALQYRQSNSQIIRSFANNISLYRDGSHITGFKSALTRVMNRYARQHGFLAEADPNFSGETIRAGLMAIISLRLINPQFNTADRSRLNNPEMEGIVGGVVGKGLTACFEEHPEVARAIVERIKK